MGNSSDEIMVSVSCLVYNHERYLRKCLDGFIMQKTNFKFEILVHDDASTDRSVDIIREYEEKYPNIIKPIYQKENQYSKGIKIGATWQYPRAKGKYYAICEGDDYWCDENKLQKQFDAMEANKNAVFCTHKVECMTEKGESTGKFYPRKPIELDVISSNQMMEIMVNHNSYPFQTSSYFYRLNYIYERIKNTPKFMQVANVGDVPLILYYITKGDFIYLNQTMSCYRTNSIGSWSMCNDSKMKRVVQNKVGIATYILFDVYSNGKYSHLINKMVSLQEYSIYQLSQNYKELCNKKYKWIMKSEPVKQQFAYYLCAYFPIIMKLYKSIKK